MTSTPARSGMPEHFGIRITEAHRDKLVGELDVDDRHLNNSGHVHGGALAAFADDLGGRLAGLNVPPGFRTTTIELKTNIFRACVPGRLTGVAVPVHVGRRMIVLQTSIYRADGKLAAMMMQTQMVLPSGSATSREEAAEAWPARTIVVGRCRIMTVFRRAVWMRAVRYCHPSHWKQRPRKSEWRRMRGKLVIRGVSRSPIRPSVVGATVRNSYKAALPSKRF